MPSTLQNRNESFENAFQMWVNNSLSTKIPSTVKGFSFNLFQYPWLDSNDPKFGIELIGADTFHTADSDWACSEVFEGSPRSLEIPLEYSGANWEECLEIMIKLASKYLNSNEPGAKHLNSAQGVGIGFVDGDLHVLKTK